MKKLYYIAAVALLTLGMVSCEDHDDDTNTDNQNVPEGYVDLGLPSGLLWADCNIGATTPEGYGDYYAWGMIETSSDYGWASYTYGDYNEGNGSYTMYKYNTTAMYGTVDNQTTLLPDDDAATHALGSGARMPTKAEWQELLENTASEWTSVNGVYGRKFTASNGNSIFLPAAGGRFGTGLDGVGLYGRYWSSSVLESDPYYAWGMGFIESHQDVFDGSRDFGRSVRAVRPAIQN